MAAYDFHYRPDIQGMRGISVLLVVLFHAHLYVTGGFVGVDTFFVISGFVICGGFFKNVQRNRDVSLASFYSRRVRRLLPSLSALSVVVLLAGVFLAPYSSVRFMAHTAVAATFFNANHYLMAGAGYFDPAAEKNAFLHTWSLSVEEQFYFVLPCFILLILWLARKKQKDHLKLFSWASYAVFGISFVLAACFVHLHGQTVNLGFTEVQLSSRHAFYLTPLRAWEFMAGGILAAKIPTLRPLEKTPRTLVLLAGFALLLVSGLLYSAKTPFPGLYAVLPVASTMLLIRAGCGSEEAASKGILANPVLVRIGDLSYGWYLWHWPLLVFAHASIPDMSIGILAITLVISLGLAWLNEKWLERPFRKHLPPSYKISALLFAICLALPVIAWRIHKKILANVSTSQEITAMVQMEKEYMAIGCNTTPYDPEQKRCHWGDEDGEKPWRVVLVGDSNARQFIPMLSEVVPELGGEFYASTFNNCAFSDLRPMNRGAEYSNCTDWLEKTTAALEKSPPTLLLISASYDGYISDPKWSFVDKQSGESFAGEEKIEEALDASASRLVARFRKKGIEVAFIKPIPKFSPKDVYDSEPGHLELYKGMDCSIFRLMRYPESCGMTRPIKQPDHPKWRDENLGRSAYKSSLGQNGVHEVVVDEVVCPNDTCAWWDDGEWLYRDTAHLSPEGVRRLAPLLREFIQKRIENQ